MSRSLRYLGCGLVGVLALAAVAPVATGQGAPLPRDVAEALVRVQSDQQAYLQAQGGLRQAVVEIRKKHETEPEMVHARAELDAATKDLNDTRAAAVVSLRADPRYIQLQEEIDHVAGALDPDITHSDLPDIDRAGLAQAKMEYSAQLHHMEEDALNQSPQYKAAAQRLDQASAGWTVLQSQLQTAIKSDPDLKSAQDAVAKAQTDLSSAQANLQSVVDKHHDADVAEYMKNYYRNNAYNPYEANYGYDYGGYPYYGLYTAYPLFGGAVTSQAAQTPASTFTPVPSWSPFTPQPASRSTPVPSWSPFPSSTSTPVPSWSPFPPQPTPTKAGH